MGLSTVRYHNSNKICIYSKIKGHSDNEFENESIVYSNSVS